METTYRLNTNELGGGFINAIKDVYPDRDIEIIVREREETNLSGTPIGMETEDNGLEGECPLCGKYGHIPNAETIAAIEEGRAMARGEIPSQTFHSLESLLADLNNKTVTFNRTGTHSDLF